MRRLLAVGPCIVFFLSGCLFLNSTGIYNDEAVFSAGIWPHAQGQSSPLMVMSYVGALKAWLFSALFQCVDPTPVTTRLPVVILGAVVVYLSYRLMDLLAGCRAALISCLLLATDPMFVITTTLDWGPVALQHLLLVAGMLALVYFYRSGRLWFLFAGFLCFGLGLWDKALFSLNLIAMAVAAVVTFSRDLYRLIRVRTLAIAGAGLALGALPLIIYNVAQPLATFRGNTRFSTEHLNHKSLIATRTADGSGLFGWLTSVVPPPQPGVPQNTIEGASLAIAETVQWPIKTWIPLILAIALIASLTLQRTRSGPILRFLLITTVVAWLQMALNAGTGTGVHHVVLLWPLPQLFLGTVIAELTSRLRVWGPRIATLVTAWLALSGLLVINTYHAQLIRNGPTINWTEASLPLSHWLLEHASKNEIYITDWGILEVLRLLSRGQLILRVGDDLPFLGDRIQAEIEARLKSPNAVFVGHVAGRETFPGRLGPMNTEAHRLGYRRELLHVISDRFGREIFEVYRYRR